MASIRARWTHTHRPRSAVCQQTRRCSAIGATAALSTPLAVNTAAELVIDHTNHGDGDSLFVGCVGGDTSAGINAPGVGLHLFDGRMCTFDDICQRARTDHMIANFAPCAGKVGDRLYIKIRPAWSGPPNTYYASYCVLSVRKPLGLSAGALIEPHRPTTKNSRSADAHAWHEHKFPWSHPSGSLCVSARLGIACASSVALLEYRIRHQSRSRR